MTAADNATNATTSTAADGLPLTITAAAAALRDGSLTAVDLLAKVTARAEVLDPELGTYIVRTHETALAAAEQADDELAAGRDRGLLHGIPLGIKDIVATADAPTTAQSLILRPEFGQQGDAPVVARLRAAGAVITGKLTMMEYAIGAPDPEKGFPVPRNPYRLDHWAGGSSSGTGNGVAAGLFLGGLGTDIAGSIRIPSAWCGISGMKPTFGRVPKSACVPVGFSYDHIGPMTRSARDAAAMLAVLAGYEASDACCVDRPVDGYVGALTGSVEELRMGVNSSLLDSPTCDPEVAALTRAAVEVFREAGAIVNEIELPLYKELTTATAAGFSAEAFAYHREDMGARWTDYGRPTRYALGTAMLMSGADFVQAQRVRRAASRALTETFANVDVIITPTTCMAAPPLAGLNFAEIIPALNTSYWNGCGYPAISVPMGLTSCGLPVGLQLSGRPFEEMTAFRAADTFQQLTGHHLIESPLILDMVGGVSCAV